MSLNEYLLSNARARAQEIIDSLDKSLTIIVGIISIGPIALFIFFYARESLPLINHTSIRNINNTCH